MGTIEELPDNLPLSAAFNYPEILVDGVSGMFVLNGNVKTTFTATGIEEGAAKRAPVLRLTMSRQAFRQFVSLVSELEDKLSGREKRVTN